MHKKDEDVIRVGPISIIRINLGSFGLAEDNATPVILLPGDVPAYVHVCAHLAYTLIHIYAHKPTRLTMCIH